MSLTTPAFFPAVPSSLSVKDAADMVKDEDSKLLTYAFKRDFRRVNGLFVDVCNLAIVNKTGSIFVNIMKASKSDRDYLEEIRKTIAETMPYKKASTSFNSLILNMRTVSNMSYFRDNNAAIAHEIRAIFGFGTREESMLANEIFYLSSFWIAYDQMCVNNEHKEILKQAADEVVNKIAGTNDMYTMVDIAVSHNAMSK
jgi:hypothetical protein